MRRFLGWFGVVGMSVGAGACAGPRAGAGDAGAGSGHAAEVARLMEGAFSSAAQAAADPEYFDIRLHMARIWPGASDGAWLYVEQARGDLLEEPYRQRVYRVSARPDGVVVSEVYLLPGNALDFAGAWRTPARFATLGPADLTLKEGCDVALRAAGPGRYEGGTEGTGCASERAGASYTTSVVVLDEAGMVSWDRGMDAAGAQVWGAEGGGYRFDRVEP